jgi:hypothetical protein
VIARSPALLAREHQIFARYIDTLARLIATETGARGAATSSRMWSPTRYRRGTKTASSMPRPCS